MDTLRIQQLDLRYRLPPGQASAGDRLDRVLGEAMDDLLEAALLREGVPVSEEICLREVAAPPVRVRVESPDLSVALEWARAFAAALKDAIDRGGDGVVRYRTRHQALLDMVCRVAEGDLRRAWAWRRLGLWPEETWRGDVLPADAFAVARQSAAALARHWRATIGVLRELARRGRLPAWWARLTVESMRELVRAVLLGSGADEVSAAGLMEISAPPGGPAPAPEAARGEGPFQEEARRALTASPLGQALASTQDALEAATPFARSRRVSLRALAVLALEDVAPGFARSPRARERLAAVEALAQGLRARALPSSGDGRRASPGARAGDSSARPRATAAQRAVPGAGPSGAQALSFEAAEAAGLLSPDTGSLEAGAPVEPEPPAVTARAGVLFLLNVIGSTRLHEAIAADPALADRGLRWALHTLAMATAGAEADDPAALAFAGLPPSSVPPSRGAPPPTEPEREALAAHAAALTRGLRDRLEAGARAGGVTSELCSHQDALLLDLVCRRRGVVVADPGWLEIRLDVDEVSTELRRSGLDLNPDWLPWLGVVVRFTYA